MRLEAKLFGHSIGFGTESIETTRQRLNDKERTILGYLVDEGAAFDLEIAAKLGLSFKDVDDGLALLKQLKLADRRSSVFEPDLRNCDIFTPTFRGSQVTGAAQN